MVVLHWVPFTGIGNVGELSGVFASAREAGERSRRSNVLLTV